VNQNNKKENYFKKLKKVQILMLEELEKLLPHDDFEFKELKNNYDKLSLDLGEWNNWIQTFSSYDPFVENCTDELEVTKKCLNDVKDSFKLASDRNLELQEQCNGWEQRYLQSERELKTINEQLENIKLTAMEILFGKYHVLIIWWSTEEIRTL
jgi:DNA repair exonuclease SbcCD ATPase subunit